MKFSFDDLEQAVEITVALHIPDGVASRQSEARLSFLRGFLNFRRGEWEAALRHFEAATRHAPHWIDLRDAVAEVMFRLERWAESLAHLDVVHAARPDDQHVLANRAILLERLHRDVEALQTADAALARNPKLLAALHARGRVLGRSGLLHEAQDSLSRAAALQPADIEPWIDASIAYLAANRPREAAACAKQALRRTPGSTQATYALAMAKLGLGDLRGGWQAFEARWGHPQLIDSHVETDRPKWLGQVPLRGQTILLWAEQGFGDTLQFCRYATMVARDAKVVLLVPPPLLRLMRSLQDVSQVADSLDDLPAFEWQTPMMSLPLAMNTTPETIPGHIRYLCADLNLVRRWQARLSGVEGLKVGVVWRADPRHYNPELRWIARRKSACLGDFAPLSELGGVQFISLQKGPSDSDGDARPPSMPWLDFTADLHDFADTAGLIEALDLVITVDTAVAHLAGALGKPVWILLSWNCCWRWFRNRVTSPWYPTARLFRQPKQGDWNSVMTQVAAALRNWTTSTSSTADR